MNKIIDTENLSKIYSPSDVEQKWYSKWENGGYFKPRMGKQNKSYCIIMPPPNVTGKLHAGHALDVATQDTMIRFKRMKGFETLWLPGMDHAGIATQSVVEKMIFEKEKKTKKDFTREEFVNRIWQWKEESGGIIHKQQRFLGASPDWNYSMFTMDPEANEAVRTFFVQMYNEGLIYQSDYIVHWDPVLQSAISDAEVDHEEVQGAFYHILYPIIDSEQKLEIATTRPETLLGDTAVAVNPNDPRFSHLIGKKVKIPFCHREVPIIGDEHVDLEMGTGCLKVTPGHDFNDFAIGERHQLPIVNILNKDGTLNQEAGEFEGLPCLQARKIMVKKLEEMGLLVKVEPHTHQVGHSQRSGAIVEPMVSKQWFLNIESMAAEAVASVEQDKMRFIPKGWENTYYAWLRNPKNWCISRQLLWGHRIPVYSCGCQHTWASVEEPTSCPKCNSKKFEQDPDTLDTWFSSGLWPMTTLGWPNPERMKQKGFDRFFPTDVLVTGYDIIFFWVARMMMMSLKATGQEPFSKTYIHAIVRDKFGRKMSKSLGNGLDPLEVISQYGADAFRFTLTAGSGYNRNLNLDPERIEGYRNFINKLWNAFRFISPHLNSAKNELPSEKTLSHHERWILSELNTVAAEMNKSIEEFRFDDACSTIYQFVYEKFCSWFIEISKNLLSSDMEAAKIKRATVLRFCFKKIVALLHPFIPFITEEIWEQLKSDREDMLIITEYPEYDPALNFQEDQEQMNKLIEVITSIRNLRQKVNIKPKDEVNVELFTNHKDLQEYFKSQSIAFADLARVKDITIANKDFARPKKSVMQALTHTEVFLPLDGVIDLSEQIARLQKEYKKTSADFDKLDKKISNQNFIQSAPEEVVTKVRQEWQELKEKLEAIQENLSNFQ